MKIYLAGSRQIRCTLRRLRDELIAARVDVAARWLDQEIGDSDDVPDASARLDMNREDIASADAVVAVMFPGNPIVTVGEIAWALAKGKPVVWIHGPHGLGVNLWVSDRLVVKVENPGWLGAHLVFQGLEAAHVL